MTSRFWIGVSTSKISILHLTGLRSASSNRATAKARIAAEDAKKKQKFEKHAKSNLSNSKIIDPRSKNKLYWDCMIIFLVLYTILSIPFRIGYRMDHSVSFYAGNYVIDVIYLVDMIFTFKTAYLDPTTDNYIHDKNLIQLKYLTSWFVADVLTIIPFEVIICIVAGQRPFLKYYYGNVQSALILGLCLKMLRINKIYGMASILKGFKINPLTLSGQKLILKIVFVCHILACFWNYVATDDYEMHGQGYTLTDDDVASESCSVTYNDPTWIKQFGYANASLLNRYIASLYFILTTMLTIGYGDIRAVNTSERSFSIFAELVGVLIFAAIIAQIVELIKKVDPKKRATKEAVKELQAYLCERPIPAPLVATSKKACAYYMLKKPSVAETDVFDILQLPTPMLHQLISKAYGSEMKQFPFLKNSSIKFVSDIVIYLKPFLCKRGSIILDMNDVVEELCFVSSGSVGLWVPEKSRSKGFSSTSSKKGAGRMTHVGNVSVSCCFGDMEYVRGTQSLVTYKAMAKCSFLSINFDILEEAFANNVNEEEKFYDDAFTRYQSLITVFSSDLVKEDDKGTSSDSSGGGDHRVDFWLDGQVVPYVSLSSFSTSRTSDSHMLVLDYDYETKSEVVIEFSKVALGRRLIFHPENSRILIWLMIIFVMVLYSVISMSLIVSFRLDPTPFSITLDWLVTFGFFIDILIRFRTAFFDTNDILVIIPSRICMEYLQTWFLVDLLATIPFDAIFSEMSKNNGDFRVISFLKILRILRLLKLKRLTIVIQKMETLITLSAGVTEIAKLMLMLMTLAHFLCCIWWLITSGLTTNTWFDLLNLRSANFYDKYTASLYYTITTLTTVGYGDIVPINASEQIVTMVIELIGGIAFGYVVGNMSSLLSNLDLSKLRTEEKVDVVKQYLEEREVSKSFMSSVIRQLKYRLRSTSVFDEDALLAKLPTRIVRDILYHRHYEAISKIALFEYISNKSVIIFMHSKMEPYFFNKGQLIVAQKDTAIGVIFIVRGLADLFVTKITYDANYFALQAKSRETLDAEPVSSSASRPTTGARRRGSRKNTFHAAAGTDLNNMAVLNEIEEERKAEDVEKDLEEEAKDSSYRKANNIITTTTTSSTLKHKKLSTKKVIRIGSKQAGDCIGYEALSQDGINAFSARAITPTNTFLLKQDELDNIESDNPSLALLLQKAFAQCILQDEVENFRIKSIKHHTNFTNLLHNKFEEIKEQRKAATMAATKQTGGGHVTKTMKSLFSSQLSTAKSNGEGEGGGGGGDSSPISMISTSQHPTKTDLARDSSLLPNVPNQITTSTTTTKDTSKNWSTNKKLIPDHNNKINRVSPSPVMTIDNHNHYSSSRHLKPNILSIVAVNRLNGGDSHSELLNNYNTRNPIIVDFITIKKTKNSLYQHRKFTSCPNFSGLFDNSTFDDWFNIKGMYSISYTQSIQNENTHQNQVQSSSSSSSSSIKRNMSYPSLHIENYLRQQILNSIENIDKK